jgi:tripartite-type tricarboxylate transporter receptor subunit TctC
MIDLLSGQMQVMFATMASSLEYVKAGKLRALAITTAARSDARPEIPPLADFVPGYESSDWYGIGAPKRTPSEIIELLSKEINAALSDPAMKARFTDQGGTVFPTSPAEFGKFIADDTERCRQELPLNNHSFIRGRLRASTGAGSMIKDLPRTATLLSL